MNCKSVNCRYAKMPTEPARLGKTNRATTWERAKARQRSPGLAPGRAGGRLASRGTLESGCVAPAAGCWSPFRRPASPRPEPRHGRTTAARLRWVKPAEESWRLAPRRRAERRLGLAEQSHRDTPSPGAAAPRLRLPWGPAGRRRTAPHAPTSQGSSSVKRT